jgi:hypothetical protein
MLGGVLDLHEAVAELFAQPAGFADEDWGRFRRFGKQVNKYRTIPNTRIPFSLTTRAPDVSHPWAKGWTRNAPAL